MKDEIKHEFVDYPKEYENAFCSDDKIKVHSKSKMTTDYPGGFDEYERFFKKFMKKMSEDRFLEIIKYYWLQRRFHFSGKPKNKYIMNNHALDSAFSFFCRYYLGTSHTVMFGSFMFYKVLQVIVEWYPDLDNHNPFTEPSYYKWPFKNVTIDFLTVVYQMPERMDLLNMADKKNMSYNQFLDYVINYIYVYNTKHSDEYDVFSLVYKHRGFPPFVRFNTKRRYERSEYNNLIS